MLFPLWLFTSPSRAKNAGDARGSKHASVMSTSPMWSASYSSLREKGRLPSRWTSGSVMNLMSKITLKSTWNKSKIFTKPSFSAPCRATACPILRQTQREQQPQPHKQQRNGNHVTSTRALLVRSPKRASENEGEKRARKRYIYI